MRHAYRFLAGIVLAVGCIFAGVLVVMDDLGIPSFFVDPPTVVVSGTVETANFTMNCAPGVVVVDPAFPPMGCDGIAVRLETSANSDVYPVGRVYNVLLRDGTHRSRGDAYAGAWAVIDQPNMLMTMWQWVLGVVLVVAGVAVLRIVRHRQARLIRPEQG